MRVASLGVARPAYYDRNASGTRQRYNAAIAPATFTTRWTATIASGKKAFVEAVFVRCFQATLPPAIGFMETYVETSDGVTNTLLASARAATSLTVKQQAQDRVAGTITLYAGNSIYCTTVDDSTGGTVQFTGDALYTIFDA